MSTAVKWFSKVWILAVVHVDASFLESWGSKFTYIFNKLQQRWLWLNPGVI